MIIYKDQIVMAMYQEQAGTIDRETEMTTAHQAQVGSLQPRKVEGKRVNYWFWDKDGQRLMICGFYNQNKQLELTTCMGDDKVLDALGISYEKALQDAASIDATFALDKTPVGSAK